MVCKDQNEKDKLDKALASLDDVLELGVEPEVREEAQEKPGKEAEKEPEKGPEKKTEEETSVTPDQYLKALKGQA